MKNQEPLVLVGIGKHNLKDLLDQAAASLEGQRILLAAFDKYKWPPRYRRASICTEEEIAAFATYVNWVMEHLKEN